MNEELERLMNEKYISLIYDDVYPSFGNNWFLGKIIIRLWIIYTVDPQRSRYMASISVYPGIHLKYLSTEVYCNKLYRNEAKFKYSFVSKFNFIPTLIIYSIITRFYVFLETLFIFGILKSIIRRRSNFTLFDSNVGVTHTETFKQDFFFFSSIRL